MKTLAFFFALMAPCFCIEPIKPVSFTLRGFEYKNSTLKKLDENTALVVHASGSSRIPINLLSAELQTQLGYNAVAAAKEFEEQQKIDKAAEQQRMIAAIPYTKFWVSQNTNLGLIVGNFEKVETSSGYSAGMSMSRFGGGGSNPSYGSTKTTWERGESLSWIPHTPETRNLLDDSEFRARVLDDGTIRLPEDGKLIRKYKLLALEK